MLSPASLFCMIKQLTMNLKLLLRLVKYLSTDSQRILFHVYASLELYCFLSSFSLIMIITFSLIYFFRLLNSTSDMIFYLFWFSFKLRRRGSEGRRITEFKINQMYFLNQFLLHIQFYFFPLNYLIKSLKGKQNSSILRKEKLKLFLINIS